MYIVSFGNNKIVRANLDGSGPLDLGNPGGFLVSPRGIALDLAGSRMYVTNNNNHMVQANLDGTGGVDLGNPGLLLAGGPFGLALDLAPDLQVTKTNTIGGGQPPGGDFNWTLRVANAGAAPASFFDGQVLLRDNLPPGPTYGTPTVANITDIFNGWNLQCGLAAQVLTCTATGGSVTLKATTGRFDVMFNVRPNAPGTLINPTGGVCRADPDNRVPERLEDNNDCANTVSVNVPVLGRQMYVANLIPGGPLSRANLDGTDGASLGNLGLLNQPAGLALDLANGKTYIASSGNNKIVRANLDGSSPTDLGNPGGFLNTPADVALDLAGGKMYIVSYFNHKIVRANLDGSGATDLGNPGGFLNNPISMALDPANEKMYIVSRANQKIVRANLDGSGATDLGNPGGFLLIPQHLALDLLNNKMYIASSANHKIVRANLDGTGGTDLGNPGGLLNIPVGIALDLSEGRMYIVSNGNRKIVRANLDGTGGVDLGNLNGSLNNPWGIALDRRNLLLLPLLLR